MRFRTVITALAAVLAILPFKAGAQGSGKDNVFGGIVRLDRTIHDFGDIMVSDGPVTAIFKAENVSSAPMVIYNVVSSCGCTDVEWTRQPLKPGETGSIKATYKNDEGGYPFDKTLTVYFSGVKQPVILHLRGESHTKKVSLNEMYPAKFGNLDSSPWTSRAATSPRGSRRAGR